MTNRQKWKKEQVLELELEARVDVNDKPNWDDDKAPAAVKGLHTFTNYFARLPENGESPRPKYTEARTAEQLGKNIRLRYDSEVSAGKEQRVLWLKNTPSAALYGKSIENTLVRPLREDELFALMQGYKNPGEYMKP